MATPNLHTICCQLPVQERTRGDTFLHSELWIERRIQLCKRTVRYKCTSSPELIVGNLEMLRTALSDNRNAGKFVLLDGAEMWARRGLALLQAKGPRRSKPAYDPCREDSTASFFKDKGVKVTPSMWKVIQPLVAVYLENNPDDNQGRIPDLDWVLSFVLVDGVVDLDGLDAYEHKIVWVEGQVCYTSVLYTRQRTSKSYWALIDFGDFHQPGRISRYVRISLPPGQDGSPRTLRVALVDFWRQPEKEWGSEDTGPGIHWLFYKPTPLHKEYAVEIKSIARPLMFTSNLVASNGLGGVKTRMLFNGFDHMSGLKSL